MNFTSAFEMVDCLDKKIKSWFKGSGKAWDDMVELEQKGLSCDEIGDELSLFIEHHGVELYTCLDLVDDEHADEGKTYVSLNYEKGRMSWKVEIEGLFTTTVVESQNVKELSSSLIRTYETAKTMNDEMLESKNNCLNKLMAKDYLVIWNKE